MTTNPSPTAAAPAMTPAGSPPSAFSRRSSAPSAPLPALVSGSSASPVPGPTPGPLSSASRLPEDPCLLPGLFAASRASCDPAAFVAAAAAIAGDDSGSSPNLQPRLERSERLRRDQLGELQRQAAQITRLRADLRTTARRARDRARTNARLRRDLRIARREEQQ
jgi:hypothetical protein